MRFPSNLAVLALALLILTIAADGQSTTSLHGAVSDAKGGVITNATVTLSNADTGFSRITRTDGQGAYQFLQIPPATYQVLVQAAGFAPLKQDNVVLQVSSPATLNITVEIRGTTEVVEVPGAAPLVNTQDASQGHVFDSIQLTRLPSEGRDPVSILSLQPGVTYTGKHDHDTQDNDSRGGSVSGGRSDQANIMLDGLDNNDQLFGYAFEGALRATLDSLQEFRVTTTNANADAGRSSGAQVNLVTRTGTNAWHGTLYEYHRPTFTAANDPFNKQAQIKSGLPNIPGKVLRNTFGGTVGGPIKKDRAFFFLAYEGDRLRESLQTTRTIPSDELRAGIVRYRCDSTEDASCVVGTAAPGVTVTSAPGLGATELLVTMDRDAFAATDTVCTDTCPLGGGANHAVLDVFNLYPSPNSDAAGDGLDYRGFTFAAPNPNDLNTYIAKLDFKLTANGNHSVFIRGNLQNDRILTAPQFPGQPANDIRTANNKGIAVGYTALLSSTLINNFRYSFVRQGNGSVGLSTANIADFRGLDDPTGFTRTTLNNVPVHNFVDDISWTKGKHSFQFGTNWRLVGNNRQSDLQSNSSALTNVFWLDNAGIANTDSSLDPAAFGYPAVSNAFSVDYDFATAAVAGLLPEVDTVYNQDKTGALIPNGQLVPRHFHAFEAEFYAQDVWRVTPHLVLTAGLRYSLLQPPYETHGNQAASDISLNQFFQQRGQDMLDGKVFRPEITLDISGQANGRKPYWEWDYRNLAPRFAFAYSPHSDNGFWRKLLGGANKSSIRGGYGLYFDHFGQGVVNTFDRQGSFGLTTILLNPAGTQNVDCTARFSGLTEIPTGTFCDQNVTPPAPGSFPVVPPGGTAPGSFAIYWGLDDKLKTPYSHVMDFSITRELASNFVLELSYTGRLGRRLLQESDLAMPLDLVDPQSGMDYFQAATLLAQAAENNVDIKDLAPIPYWENLFPAAAHAPRGLFGCEGKMNRANVTATQAVYDTFSCFLHNETTALFLADTPQFHNGDCLPACSTVNGDTGPFHFFHDQFSSLYAWRSQGTSSYHALQASIRHAMSRGLQFDFNYTYSKSIDLGSNAERISQYESGSVGTGGFGSQVINAWSPGQLRSVSDFDTTHQFNANWIYELPFGKGKTFGAGWTGAANAIAGGWSISGLARWTSGLPFTVYAGDGWATNWELQGTSFLTGNPGAVGGVYRDPDTGDPNMFRMAITDPQALHDQFRSTHPGESGQRNIFRGPGYFGVDLGLGKTWAFKESQSAEFRWEVFNATNSVRFDAAGSAINESLSDSGSFGKYQSTLTTARRMQFSLRYSF
jgi:hypothetical protein